MSRPPLSSSPAARTPTEKLKKKRSKKPSPHHTPPAPPPAPPPPPVASRCARLPYGVSGWVDLSARHRLLLGFGPKVYQRRFFEIDWTRRRISYFNACRREGDFTFGDGPKKEIAMENIIRIVSPSEHARALVSGVRNAPFDIVTPDRIYTLVPLLIPRDGALRPPSEQQGGRGDGGSKGDDAVAAAKAGQMSPNREESSRGGDGRRSSEGGGGSRLRSGSGGGSWGSWDVFGGCGCAAPPLHPGGSGRPSDIVEWDPQQHRTNSSRAGPGGGAVAAPNNNNNNNYRQQQQQQQQQQQRHSQRHPQTPPRAAPPCPPPPPPSFLSPQVGALQSTPYDGPPTLSVRDFRVPIVDSNFSPRDAGSTLKRLLRKREVTDTGVPWEFECPLTLELMEDPVVAADGNTYERAAIEEWYERSNGAPVMGDAGDDYGATTASNSNGNGNGNGAGTTLRPNYRLREEIAAYKKAKAFLQEQALKQKQKQKQPTSK